MGFASYSVNIEIIAYEQKLASQLASNSSNRIKWEMNIKRNCYEPVDW